VAGASAALLVFPQRFLYSMGVGALVVALVSAAVALLVLPSVLVLLGPRVDSLAPARLRPRERPVHTSLWYRGAARVMRRPWFVAAFASLALIVVGLPALGVQFTGFDGRALPESTSARQVGDTLDRDFTGDATAPIYVSAHVSSNDPRLAGYVDALRTLPGAVAVSAPSAAGRALTRIDVVSREAPLAASTQRLVKRVRAIDAGFAVRVGGPAARWHDQQTSLVAHLPAALAILAATTLALLLVLTGSVVLPLKALLMNLLTLGATMGILVAVFQEGRLEELLGYTSVGALDATQPILLAVVAFALSTDYGIFLLTRIKEARDRGADEADAVATGVARTGPSITAAAALFAVAVGAFATSEIVFIKQLGLGMALAVLIDATLVRALLVPSLMKLLGRWNWWSPRLVRRLHGQLIPQAQET
jgi:RND superfamily putative drug exporter